MSQAAPPRRDGQVVEINLRNPTLAAVLAWLWPGAGHLYQRRFGKGIMFMACILGTYFFGLGLGGGRVVYASFQRGPDFRYPYFLQVGVGLPALPALLYSQKNLDQDRQGKASWMAPPHINRNNDELSAWHKELGRYFELGTLYTMVAGLLNVLVILDAYGGPALPEDEPDPAAKGPGQGSS